MPTTQQLREQRATAWEKMKGLIEQDSMTAEESQTYDRLEQEVDDLGVQIARAERHDLRAADFGRVETPGAAATVTTDDEPPATDRDRAYAQAFASYMRSGTSALSNEAQALLRSGWVEGPQNAQGVGTGAAGGFTVPPAFRQKIVEMITYVAAMRQYAEVINTETGASLPWPTVDDTANEGAILAENTQDTEQDVTFGQATLDAYMYTSKLVRVSLQLLQDNAFDLDNWLAKALGNRIGRIQNRHFTVGTGTGQPDGIVTSAGVGKTGATGQTTTVTYDDLVDLVESIDPAYLESGNARFMMSQSARKAIRKLKDSQNRPLWEPSIQAGVADSLLGYPVALNNYVPVPAASAKSIIFGDIREAYVIRDVSEFALLRLAERYADFLQVGFIGFQRSDGTLQNGSAVKAYQHSAT